jgi:AraC-like DNA-binding protein
LDLSEDEVSACLDACGAPPIAALHPDMVITLPAEIRGIVYVVSQHVSGTPPLLRAVRASMACNAVDHGVLGLAVLHAECFEDVARMLSEYPELWWGHTRMVANRTKTALWLTARYDGMCDRRHPWLPDYLTVFDLVAMTRLLVDVFGPVAAPFAIDLTMPRPDCADALSEALGCPLRFEQPATRAWFPATLAGRPAQMARPEAARACRYLARSVSLAVREQTVLEHRCRQLLDRLDPLPDRDHVAMLLGMSGRTLARRLQDEGLTFSEIRKDVFLHRARALLGTGRAVGEVAATLGYSETAAFTPAFRAGTGLTPSAWRRIHV